MCQIRRWCVCDMFWTFTVVCFESKFVLKFNSLNIMLTETQVLHMSLFFLSAEKNSNAVVELNYSAAAILSMVPSIYHKYLTTKTRNQSYGKTSLTTTGK